MHKGAKFNNSRKRFSCLEERLLEAALFLLDRNPLEWFFVPFRFEEAKEEEEDGWVGGRGVRSLYVALMSLLNVRKKKQVAHSRDLEWGQESECQGVFPILASTVDGRPNMLFSSLLLQVALSLLQTSSQDIEVVGFEVWHHRPWYTIDRRAWEGGRNFFISWRSYTVLPQCSSIYVYVYVCVSNI